jgi:hypothetical protein
MAGYLGNNAWNNVHLGNTAVSKVYFGTDLVWPDGFDPAANFGIGFNGPIFAVAQQSDGKILIGGDFTTYKGSTVASGLVRLSLNGDLDTTFNTTLGTGFVKNTITTSPVRNVASIKVWSDGSIYVGGDFTSLNGTGVNQIVKLDNSGNIDGTFVLSSIITSSGTIGYDYPVILTIEEGLHGDLLIGGFFTSIVGYSPQPQYAASVNPTTGLQSSDVPVFARSTGTDIGIYKIRRISGNRIMLGGGFDNITFKGVPGITTYKAAIVIKDDGVGGYDIDTTFAWGGAPTAANARSVFDFIEKSDGKFILVGNFSTTTPASIRAITSTGGNDATFVAGTGFSVGTATNTFIRARAMTLLESGSFVYVGGTMSQYKGLAVDLGIVRLDKSTGTIDNSFNPSAGILGGSLTMVTQLGPVINNTSGSLFMYGSFATYDGISAGNIAQPSATGSMYTQP